MFKVGDRVQLKKDTGWWYTVTDVLPYNFVRLRFGAIGGDAGSFKVDELVHLGESK